MLFVYGTLRDHDLLGGVLGRLPAAFEAVAPGFAAVHHPGQVYPALIRRPGAGAPGLVLTGLTPFEMDLLDAFEGEQYRRGIVPVMIGEELHEAFAYLPVAAPGPGAPTWTLARWQQEHKAQVLAGERDTAAQLRARLIAIRPH